jgi:hypothetical protein
LTESDESDDEFDEFLSNQYSFIWVLNTLAFILKTINPHICILWFPF